MPANDYYIHDLLQRTSRYLSTAELASALEVAPRKGSHCWF